MMKRLLFAVPALMLAVPVQAGAPVPGVWRTPAMGGAWLRFESCGNAICGRIVRIEGETAANPRLDSNNPDPARRRDRLVGKFFITGLQGGPKTWTKGKIYHPPSGKSVDGKMKLLNASTLEIEACLFGMCKKSRVTKVG